MLLIFQMNQLIVTALVHIHVRAFTVNQKLMLPDPSTFFSMSLSAHAPLTKIAKGLQKEQTQYPY